MPVTIEERMELGEELRIPASFEEFLDLLEKCEYRIEYDDGEIISFMGYGTKNHEKIIIRLGQLLSNMLNIDLFSIYGSNLALHIPGYAPRYYNADCTVVKGEDEEVILKGNMTAISNPILIIEVLSMSNYDFDLGGKFKNYKKIPALQQVIYIDSTEMSVISFTRYNGDGDWLLKEFTDPKSKIPVLSEGHLILEDVYKNINL